jgi:hypothetical protein
MIDRKAFDHTGWTFPAEQSASIAGHTTSLLSGHVSWPTE